MPPLSSVFVLFVEKYKAATRQHRLFKDPLIDANPVRQIPIRAFKVTGMETRRYLAQFLCKVGRAHTNTHSFLDVIIFLLKLMAKQVTHLVSVLSGGSRRSSRAGQTHRSLNTVSSSWALRSFLSLNI